MRLDSLLSVPVLLFQLKYHLLLGHTGKFLVNVYKRPKYATPDSSSELGVITAPMPDHPIEKCKADVGLISYIIVSKFADHLPIYRQNGIFER